MCQERRVVLKLEEKLNIIERLRKGESASNLVTV